MRHVFLIITWKGQYLRKLLPKIDDIGFFGDMADMKRVKIN